MDLNHLKTGPRLRKDGLSLAFFILESRMKNA